MDGYKRSAENQFIRYVSPLLNVLGPPSKGGLIKYLIGLISFYGISKVGYKL
jgi:hypothetical protein